MDTITPYLDELVEFLKNASPLVWETAVRQVYAEVIGDLPMFLLLLFAGSAAAITLRATVQRAKSLGAEEEKLNERGAYVPTSLEYRISSTNRALAIQACIAGVALVSACIYLSLTIPKLINPNFYAMKMLLGLVGVQ